MKESETRELKKSTSELKEAMISIVSILNKHQKGELYFGVKNTGEIIGQTVTENTIREVSKAISDNIKPKIFPKINTLILESKNCVHIEFIGNNLPYYAFGRAYIRVGDEDKKLSAQKLEDLILRKNTDKLRWETEICRGATIQNIAMQRLRWFLKESGLEYHSPKNSLDKLGLLKEGKLLNAAIILFGKKPQQFFPNAKLRCALFGTVDTSFTIDMHEYEGNVFHLIEKAEKYILDRINIGMKVEGLRRIDIPEINIYAFREAIINAFCHRDYFEYDSVNIAIFRDRVEIRSPGNLYGGLTIEKIKKEMVSKRRNEVIAEMLHKVHFIEKWGRGISLILSKEPRTEFKIIARIFITTFKRKHLDKRKDLQEKGVEKGVEKLSENEKKILALIAKNSYISKAEIVVKWKLTKKTVEYNIESLKKKGILKRVGGAKGGYWKIINNAEIINS